MEKLMYLCWLPKDVDPVGARELMVDDVGGRLLGLDVAALTVDVDDDASQFPSPAPTPEGEHPIGAIVSVWLDCYDRRDRVESTIASVCDRIAGYSVVESMYREYGGNQWSGPRDWPDGVRSPGPLTVTVFEQHPDFEFDDWIDFWHSRQSPMSEAIQPRTRYVRNAVFRAITPDAPGYRAIVEEAWPSVESVMDPMQFFCGNGDVETLKANINTMIETTTAFIPYETMRNLTMSEWILRS
jgi:hypothetical protein